MRHPIAVNQDRKSPIGLPSSTRRQIAALCVVKKTRIAEIAIKHTYAASGAVAPQRGEEIRLRKSLLLGSFSSPKTTGGGLLVLPAPQTVPAAFSKRMTGRDESGRYE